MPDKEEILLSKRLQYITVKDKGYKRPLLFLAVSIIAFIILCIFYMNIAAVFALLVGILGAPVYYVLKPRYCNICSQKMIRFAHDTEIYFCCDHCQTRFRSAIGADSDSGD